ncbi:E3 ubiquitin-protein ligase, partial [Tetrabaena socialis]
MNELKSLALLSTTTKQCPMCSMGVEKAEGCNKITCCYCGAFFCWLCNSVISGYDHFSQSEGAVGGCVLFEQQEIDRWNARWNG